MTTKTPVKKQTSARAKSKNTPQLDKYVNNTNQNIFTEHGRLQPTETIMLTGEQASKILGISKV